MTSIFDLCDQTASRIKEIFISSSDVVHEYYNKDLNIDDEVFSNDNFRRAHISIVDARATHKLWLLHTTIFPFIDDGSPIFGFDIIAGPNKVSGAFHDFSNGGEPDHYMMKWFADQTKELEWNKKRELPSWAKNIFSDSIVAIGAVGTEELEKFSNLGINSLNYYVDNVGYTETSKSDYTQQQNYYCQNQKLNPHTPRVLVNLGFTENQAYRFVNNYMFPEIG